jgi:hypothetical protein
MRRSVPIDDAELFRARIDQFLSAARIKAGFNGAVLVARGEQPVYQGAFGFSRLESKAAVSQAKRRAESQSSIEDRASGVGSRPALGPLTPALHRALVCQSGTCRLAASAQESGRKARNGRPHVA